MRRIGLILISAGSLLALSACNAGSPAGTDTSSAPISATQAVGDLTPIEVGVIAIGDVAPMYLGLDEGIFEKHGLEVTLTPARGGAAIVPAVQSGQMDFGFSNVSTLIIGREAGLPLKIVATGPQSTGDPENDYAAVLVPEDSDIETLEDLEGSRVAVNTLNNILDTTISEGLRQVGGDPDAVEYLEVSPPDTLAQLEAGNVDAMSATEPFVFMAEQIGAKRIYGLFAEPVENLSVAGYFTTDQMIEDDPELVAKFSAAVQESQQFATDNPDKVRSILSEYMPLEADVLEGMTLPRFPQKHNIDSLEQVALMLQKSGVIDDLPATSDLIIDSAGH